MGMTFIFEGSGDGNVACDGGVLYGLRAAAS